MRIADLRLAAAAVAVVVLSACGATIPDSGPVVEGQPVQGGGDSQFIRVIARPPAAGASATEIVQGFLEASGSFQDDYAVARQYLAGPVKALWNPSIETRVYDGAGVTTDAVGLNQVSFSAPLTGTIDPQGSYTVAETGTTEALDFQLVREDGQWRITTPPVGLLLSRGDVERSYRTYDVYFLDPQFRTLVPDPITMPTTGSSAATALIRRLVEGPTDWLAPAVRTAFPSGAALTVDAVPIDSGVAQVTLDSRVLATDDSTRAALSAQIVWTLRQLPEVTGVRITAGGVPLPVPGQPAVQSRDAWPTYDPNALAPTATAYAVTERGVARLEGGFVAPVEGEAGSLVQPLTTLAVAPDGGHVAGLNEERTLLLEAPVVNAGAFTVRAKGKGLSSVGYGPDGALWWVEGNTVRTLTALATQPQTVAVDGIGKARVVDLALARDGTRAAVVLRRGPRAEVLLARIERRADSVRLAAPRRIETRISSALDVAWESATELAVLGTQGAAALQVFTVPLGVDAVSVMQVPEKSVSVAAAPGRRLLVGTAPGSVYAYDAVQWSRLAGGSSPTYP